MAKKRICRRVPQALAQPYRMLGEFDNTIADADRALLSSLDLLPDKWEAVLEDHRTVGPTE